MFQIEGETLLKNVATVFPINPMQISQSSLPASFSIMMLWIVSHCDHKTIILGVTTNDHSFTELAMLVMNE